MASQMIVTRNYEISINQESSPEMVHTALDALFDPESSVGKLIQSAIPEGIWTIGRVRRYNKESDKDLEGNRFLPTTVETLRSQVGDFRAVGNDDAGRNVFQHQKTGKIAVTLPEAVPNYVRDAEGNPVPMRRRNTNGEMVEQKRYGRPIYMKVRNNEFVLSDEFGDDPLNEPVAREFDIELSEVNTGAKLSLRVFQIAVRGVRAKAFYTSSAETAEEACEPAMA